MLLINKELYLIRILLGARIIQ